MHAGTTAGEPPPLATSHLGGCARAAAPTTLTSQIRGAAEYVRHGTCASPRTDSWEDDRKSSRVLRGGAWDHDPTNLRCAYRGANHPSGRVVNFALRCARGL